MATTFSERKVALDEIAARIRTDAKRMTNARAQVAEAEADLTTMQTAYTALVADINADAAAFPADAVFAAMKGEKDKLVAEFQALKTKATNTKNAMDGVA
jgi:hypothetical protein